MTVKIQSMRKIILIMTLVLVAVLQLAAKPPHVYVKVRPNAPNVVVVRPACPGPKHVWIDGDWVWSPKANQYVWVEGKWVVPNNGVVWVPGHWKNTKYGWRWVPGHWK